MNFIGENKIIAVYFTKNINISKITLYQYNLEKTRRNNS